MLKPINDRLTILEKVCKNYDVQDYMQYCEPIFLYSDNKQIGIWNEFGEPERMVQISIFQTILLIEVLLNHKVLYIGKTFNGDDSEIIHRHCKTMLDMIDEPRTKYNNNVQYVHAHTTTMNETLASGHWDIVIIDSRVDYELVKSITFQCFFMEIPILFCTHEKMINYTFKVEKI